VNVPDKDEVILPTRPWRAVGLVGHPAQVRSSNATIRSGCTAL